MEPHCTHLFMEVADLDRARTFWIEAMGLQLLDDRSPHYIAVGGHGGFAIGIEPAASGRVTSDGPEITIRVDNVDAHVERLRSHGVRIVEEPADQAWGARHAWLLDPDGRRMSVYSSASSIMDQAAN